MPYKDSKTITIRMGTYDKLFILKKDFSNCKSFDEMFEDLITLAIEKFEIDPQELVPDDKEEFEQQEEEEEEEEEVELEEEIRY